MIRRLIAALLKMPLVYTQDFDGEVRLRLVHDMVFERHFVKGILGTTIGELLPDGTIEGGRYLRRWKPANQTAQNLIWERKEQE